jgi:hypothetical protein
MFPEVKWKLKLNCAGGSLGGRNAPTADLAKP